MRFCGYHREMPYYKDCEDKMLLQYLNGGKIYDYEEV